MLVLREMSSMRPGARYLVGSWELDTHLMASSYHLTDLHHRAGVAGRVIHSPRGLVSRYSRGVLVSYYASLSTELVLREVDSTRHGALYLDTREGS